MEFVEEQTNLALRPELTSIDELVVQSKAVMFLVEIVQVIDPELSALHWIDWTSYEVGYLRLINRSYTIDMGLVKVCTIEWTKIGSGRLDRSPVYIQAIVLDVRIVT